VKGQQSDDRLVSAAPAAVEVVLEELRLLRQEKLSAIDAVEAKLTGVVAVAAAVIVLVVGLNESLSPFTALGGLGLTFCSGVVALDSLWPARMRVMKASKIETELLGENGNDARAAAAAWYAANDSDLTADLSRKTGALKLSAIFLLSAVLATAVPRFQ